MNESKKIIGVVAFCLLGLFLLITAWNSFTIVEGGFVGVKKRLGNVSNEELEQGIHFIIPFVDSVTKIDTRLVPIPIDAKAASKDLQKVTTQVTLAHHLTGSMAAETYQKIGALKELDAAVVGPGIQEAVKAVTAQYTAEELITRRSTVKLQIEEAIKSYLAKSLLEAGVPGAINVNSVAITDFQFSKEFDESIEAKVKAEQEALKAENEKKTKITQAEALAESIKRAAEAEAYKTQKEAEARATAIKVEGEALRSNPSVLQLRAIERWKGYVPTFQGGNGQLIPFVNVDQLQKHSAQPEQDGNAGK
jgi:regulator of protease activity HflC (stomatin/prohibitin superfamily)